MRASVGIAVAVAMMAASIGVAGAFGAHIRAVDEGRALPFWADHKQLTSSYERFEREDPLAESVGDAGPAIFTRGTPTLAGGLVSLASLLAGQHQGERVRTAGFVRTVSDPEKAGWEKVRWVGLAERNEDGELLVCAMQRSGSAPTKGARFTVLGTMKGRMLVDCVAD